MHHPDRRQAMVRYSILWLYNTYKTSLAATPLRPPSGRAAHHVLHVLGAFADDAPVAEGRLRAKVGI